MARETQETRAPRIALSSRNAPKRGPCPRCIKITPAWQLFKQVNNQNGYQVGPVGRIRLAYQPETSQRIFSANLAARNEMGGPKESARPFPRRQTSSYSRPCSCFSWQVTQCRAQGTASRRFSCSSSSHCTHVPNLLSLIRRSASSINANMDRSVLVWPNKNSFVYELAALSARSTVGSSSAVRPSSSVRAMLFSNSSRRVASFFL